MRDRRRFIEIETTVVPPVIKAGEAARVHVVLRPNAQIKAHWNNEVEPLQLWVNPPKGWAVSSQHVASTNPPQAVSTETRELQFEVRSSEDAAPGNYSIPAYALYYVCEDVRRCDICRDLERSPRWFDKWWGRYGRDPHTDFADQSRAPHSWPQQIPPEVVRTVVAVRKTLEAARTPQTRYGFRGPGAIQGRLRQLKVKPLPSLSTIERILHAQGLTHPVGAAQATAYYPWPVAWDVNAIQATDVITRHVHGGQVLENFHTIDHYSHAVWMSQHADQSSATARAHLLETWAKLGLPRVHQFDNAGAFCGGHTHTGLLGQVVRLCLFCGVEPWFIPVYEAERNYWVEGFHSLWVQGFWSRHRFRNLGHVQGQAPVFWRWYHDHYRPPSLQGKTPAQMRRGAAIWRLNVPLRRLIPEGRLPITAGRVHILRRVNEAGYILWRLYMTCYLNFVEIAHDVVTTGLTRDQAKNSARCRDY